MYDEEKGDERELEEEREKWGGKSQRKGRSNKQRERDRQTDRRTDKERARKMPDAMKGLYTNWSFLVNRLDHKLLVVEGNVANLTPRKTNLGVLEDCPGS